MNTIPERIGVSGFGWRNNNTEFIVPGMVHSYTLDTDDVAPQSVINGYIPAGDHNIWLQSMTDVIKNNIARFILSVAFAAPLLKIIGQRTFCVHNWGDSRDGKSAAQYIAMSVWGKPDTIKILASSSETGIERMASLCSDLPLCVSELETLDEYRRTEFESKIPYMVTEGKGKQRGTIKGLQQVSSWRTIMLTNAESSIVKDNSKGGIITRILEIRGGPIALRKKYPNKIDSHLDAMAALTIASEKAGMWVFSETKEVAISRSLEMAYHIIEEQLICNEDADDSERAWQWLQGWIAANDFRFGTHGTGSIAGYTDNDYIYIIKAELSKAMKFENLNPDKFYRKWADQGRIPYTSNGDKRTIAVRGKVIGGARPWCIRIKKENS
ncbi:MAG: hypothetical protein H6Q69_934 [Firmicutes bacterium]|nr:hypothetical protein [Bacillota bacterium]